MSNILDKIQLSGTTYDLIDSTAIHSLDGYWTSGQTNNAITAATNALAESIAEQGYQTSGDVQSAISGKTDTSAFTAHTGDSTIHVTVADKTAWNAKLDAADVEGLFGNVVYDSTNKRINFYHESTGGTVLAYVDATDFVKDGFLESVTLENKTISGESVPCLVFIWNTDSGIQETDIPVSGIFEPSNYYTKTEVDAIVSGINEDISAVSGDVATKQDELTPGDGIQISGNVISVTGAPLSIDDNVTSGSSNPVKSSGIYDFVTGETSTKQDTLVSGTNLKTVGTESLLGSGNVKLMTASIGTGNDSTTLIFEFN